MKILSFDQASVKTGYALFIDNELSEYGVLDFNKERDTQIRMRKMCLEIYNTILKFNPDVVVFEDVNLRTSVKTLIMLSQIQGTVIQSCYINNIDFVIYAPTAWRKVVGIIQSNKVVRADLKKQAVALIEQRYNVTVSDDCAEAVCIGLAHLHNIDNKEKKDNGKKDIKKKDK